MRWCVCLVAGGRGSALAHVQAQLGRIHEDFRVWVADRLARDEVVFESEATCG